MKPKSPKVRNKNNGINPFVKSLIYGLAVTIAVWLMLTVVFSLVMSKMDDHNSVGGVLSVVISALSLAVGGFVLAKTDKSSAFIAAIILSALVMALAFALSQILNLSNGASAAAKTVKIALMFIFCIIGVKIGSGDSSKRSLRRH